MPDDINARAADIVKAALPLRTFDIVTAADLLRTEFPPREMVLAPWLPTKGLAMLYGPRGIGKTHLTLGIGHAVATGGRIPEVARAAPAPCAGDRWRDARQRVAGAPGRHCRPFRSGAPRARLFPIPCHGYAGAGEHQPGRT